MYAMYNIVASDSNLNNNTSQVPFLYFHYKSDMENPKKRCKLVELVIVMSQTDWTNIKFSRIYPQSRQGTKWKSTETSKSLQRSPAQRDLAFQIKNGWDSCFPWLFLRFLHHRVSETCFFVSIFC